ncbi:hypothetical protein G6652_02045 [Polynucleobacter paneuropaeus]|jgi:hypothetical protein|nr:hypothetical protein [Polynucleobacter paneuropaeus]MBT8616013.1 hypothetical protein [Polynucleobacter paneuropaeus]MBT8617894.1 hypothetical protein [Polynucleobacter paneuropaeus]MBT8619775.1 hypothetical protein [Polynucleobacter paneuropaeus]MBT8625310.1 hypothetical protein [Polynucleobacter paneuropaeus]
METAGFNQNIDNQINLLLLELEGVPYSTSAGEGLESIFNYEFVNNPEVLNKDLLQELEFYLMLEGGKEAFFSKPTFYKDKIRMDWAIKEVNNPLDDDYIPGLDGESSNPGSWSAKSTAKMSQHFNPLERTFNFLVLAKKYNSMGDEKNSLIYLLNAAEMLGNLKTGLIIKRKIDGHLSSMGSKNYKKNPKSEIELNLKKLIADNHPPLSHLSITNAASEMVKIEGIKDLLQLLNIKDENWEIRIKSRISAYRKSPETFLTR